MEIKKLEIDLDVVGWDFSGGRSGNVWGQISSDNIPFDLIEKSVKKNKKSCIWTCLDGVIYQKDENGDLLLNKNVTKTISATFKPSFEPYNSLAENMGMRIAVALDMPTSYNFLVRFDKEKYPQILNNFKLANSIKNVRDIGVVSIDFLQIVDLGRKIEEEIRIFRDGKTEWQKTFRNYSGDELILFSESVEMAKKIKELSGTNFLIKNWIRSVDEFSEKYVLDFPKEKLKEQIRNVNSRIVRSFLLREFLGDCDFTDLNSGFVINDEAQTLKYAPNFDYGESFNSLIKTKLDYIPHDVNMDEVLKVDPDYIKKKERKKNNTSVKQLAQTYSSETSKDNLNYVFRNYPNETKEFIVNLNRVEKTGKFDKIVDSYTTMTNNGKPLLNEEETTMFKDYLRHRTDWLTAIALHSIEKDKKDKIEEKSI